MVKEGWVVGRFLVRPSYEVKNVELSGLAWYLHTRCVVRPQVFSRPAWPIVSPARGQGTWTSQKPEMKVSNAAKATKKRAVIVQILSTVSTAGVKSVRQKWTLRRIVRNTKDAPKRQLLRKKQSIFLNSYYSYSAKVSDFDALKSRISGRVVQPSILRQRPRNA
jgi:hypothetical protein